MVYPCSYFLTPSHRYPCRVSVSVNRRQGSTDSDEHARPHFNWGNERYSAIKAYKVLIGYKPTPPHFNWIWKSSCQPKHKIFFWQLLHDRVNTRNLLRRKNFDLEGYHGAVRDCQQEETLHHLFWSCPFASQCWDFICPNRDRNLSVLEAFHDLIDKLHLPFFMEIIIVGSWAIWISRNNKSLSILTPLFRGGSISFWRSTSY